MVFDGRSVIAKQQQKLDYPLVNEVALILFAVSFDIEICDLRGTKVLQFLRVVMNTTEILCASLTSTGKLPLQ